MSANSLDLAFRMIGEHLAWTAKGSHQSFSRVRESIIRQMDQAFLDFIEEQGHTDAERAAFLNTTIPGYSHIKLKMANAKAKATKDARR